MASANELATRILAADGVEGFPARIGISAVALADLARLRFRANQALLFLCQTLDASTDDTQNFQGNAQFTDDDTTIIGFFLAKNKAMTSLKCALESMHRTSRATVMRWLTL